MKREIRHTYKLVGPGGAAGHLEIIEEAGVPLAEDVLRFMGVLQQSFAEGVTLTIEHCGEKFVGIGVVESRKDVLG